MPTDTFASFAHRLDTFVNGISDPQLKAIMTKVGVAAKADATAAASADLGGSVQVGGADVVYVVFGRIGQERQQR